MPRLQLFCFSLSAQSSLSQFTYFTHIHSFFSLNMSEYVSFCFMFHVPHLLARLSRAIQHIFRRLAGAQYTDCITLPHQHTLCLGLHKPSQFRPFTYIYEFEQVYMCFIPNVSRLSIPPCPHRPSRVTMDHHPKGSASPS